MRDQIQFPVAGQIETAVKPQPADPVPLKQAMSDPDLPVAGGKLKRPLLELDLPPHRRKVIAAGDLHLPLQQILDRGPAELGEQFHRKEQNPHDRSVGQGVRNAQIAQFESEPSIQ